MAANLREHKDLYEDMKGSRMETNAVEERVRGDRGVLA